MYANVIGNGIAGPMVAITLAENGYTVNVYDNRAAADLNSDGVLGIVDEAWAVLEDHGVVGARKRELHNGNTGRFNKYHYLVWTDLHTSLVERASQLGVQFHYGQTFEPEPGDDTLTVRATGVGSAKEVSKGAYSGYVIVRGLAYQFSGTSWTAIQEVSPQGEWLFTAGDTREGTAITFFVPRTDVTLRTTYTPAAPFEASRLPLRWTRLLETVPIFQVVPMSDWAVPETMISGNVIRIGDANGQLRPKTSMGANRALIEASSLELLIERSQDAERGLLAHRRELHDLGIALGI